MKKIYILLLINISISFKVHGWRIEKNVLIIEKGDNLTEISHSLLGSGVKYNLIWKRCIDTLISRNPNLIYEGMRFSIDSLGTNKIVQSTTTPIILYESKPEEESHFWDAVTAVITLLSVVLAAILADYYFNRNERRKIIFDLFSEFNASEMLLHRVKADSVLAKNLLLEKELKDTDDNTKKEHPEYFRDFDELDSKQIEDKRSVYMLLNFYKRIELLRVAKRIDTTLIPILFGEIFYYWWDYCFNKYHASSDWEALKLVKNLNLWLNSKATRNQQEYWKKANQYASPKLIKPKKEETTIKLNLEDIDNHIKNLVTQIINQNKQNTD